MFTIQSICLLDAENHAMIVVIVKIIMKKLYTLAIISFDSSYFVSYFLISETNTIPTTKTLTINSKFPTVITATSMSNQIDSLMQKTATTKQIESPLKITSGIIGLTFK